MARNSLTPTQGGFLQRDVEAPLHSLHREVNRLFDDIFRGQVHAVRVTAQQPGPLMPNIDVSETDGELRIRAELPGVNDGDIDVSVDGDVLIIRGEKKFEKKDEAENFHFVESAYGTFQRALRLPGHVATDKVRAEFNDGVLTVTLPKSPEQKTSRKIPVQRGPDHVTASGPESEASNLATGSVETKPKTT